MVSLRSAGDDAEENVLRMTGTDPKRAKRLRSSWDAKVDARAPGRAKPQRAARGSRAVRWISLTTMLDNKLRD